MRPPPRRGCGYPHRRAAAVRYKPAVRRALIATAAGLALADAAVVTLALPPILLELDTTVEGVAAVIGVYTAVLTIALPISAALHNRATGATTSWATRVPRATVNGTRPRLIRITATSPR